MNFSINFTYHHGGPVGLTILDDEDMTIFEDNKGLLGPWFMENMIKEIGMRHNKDYEVHLMKTGFIDTISYHISWEHYERALDWVLSYFEALELA